MARETRRGNDMTNESYETLTPEEQHNAEINARIEQVQKALRSGKYRQCFGQIRGDYRFCFFGVAADVYDPTEWKPRRVVSWCHQTLSFYSVKDDEGYLINGIS